MIRNKFSLSFHIVAPNNKFKYDMFVLSYHVMSFYLAHHPNPKGPSNGRDRETRYDTFVFFI